MIVGILGSGGCGGTFLDWSLHYLSGNVENLVINLDKRMRTIITDQTIQAISNNPLHNKTAHGHKKTHPNNGSLKEIINRFRQNSEYNLHTFYYVDSMLPEQTATTHNTIVKDYTDIHFIDYTFEEADVNIIFCLQYEKIKKLIFNFTDAILQKTGKHVTDLPLWDQRELLSLYYPNCIRGQTLKEKKYISTNRFLLNFNDAFFNLPELMPCIFKFINKTINESKWNSWITIYKKWLTINNYEFYRDLNTIVNNIILNNNMSLVKYDITFAKEVVIASKLLYEHNLALKSYGVLTLADNTTQWSTILEKNIYHNLTVKELV